MKARHWRQLFILLSLSASCAAQDYDGSIASDRAASLLLAFDNVGSVNVNLALPEPPKSWGPLRNKLAAALHCPDVRLGNPGPDAFSSTLSAKWSDAQRRHYEQQMASYNERLLQGTCDAPLNHYGSVIAGDLSLAPLASELLAAGLDELDVSVTLPKTPFLEHSPSIRELASERSQTYLTYRLPLAEASSAPSIHLAYGFRNRDLYRAFGLLAAFLLLPLLAVLWMRRAALLAGKDDPVAAWFSFYRVFNVLVQASMLLWVCSGLGARQDLYRFVGFLRISSWAITLLHVSILIVPAFAVYLLCIAASYPVHAQLRGTQASWSEFIAQHSATIGIQAVPLMFFLAALEVVLEHKPAAVILFVLAALVFQLLKQLRLRLLKVFPQPLTTGELRDRIFSLAGQFGVQVNQIFVLPAGKGQVANAFAARNRVVLFTDYLLEHLTRREVDAVAAHELAHLRHKHPAKLTFAILGAMLLPSFFPVISGILIGLAGAVIALLHPGYGTSLNWMLVLSSAMSAFEAWPLRDFILVMSGLGGFYFLSRHFENVADETAVRIARDPEAQITGLLKLSALNRTPIHWSKTSEAWLSHPSTIRRAERIAAAGAMPASELRQILEDYKTRSRTGAGPAQSAAPEERYAVPAVAADPERERAAARSHIGRQLRVWVLLALYVALPAFATFAIHKSHLGYPYLPFAYGLGYLVSAAIITLAALWLGEMGLKNERVRAIDRLQSQGFPVGGPADTLVGLAPSPYPRLYGKRYHWDIGFMNLAHDRLLFVGEQTQFALVADEIDGIVIGPGAPGWWKSERIYVRWKTAANPGGGVFNLNLLEPGSFWNRRARIRELCRRMQAWHAKPQAGSPSEAGSSQFPAPSIGQVTCLSPKKIGGLRMSIRVLIFPFALALAAGTLFPGNIAYLCFSACILRLSQIIPFWRYRDKMPDFAPARPARAFGAAGMKSI